MPLHPKTIIELRTRLKHFPDGDIQILINKALLMELLRGYEVMEEYKLVLKVMQGIHKRYLNVCRKFGTTITIRKAICDLQLITLMLEE